MFEKDYLKTKSDKELQMINLNVFKINIEKKKFTVQEKCDRQYFQNYIEMCKDNELNVYIIEYTKNRKLINKIKSYCEKKSFHYYISSSIELM